MMRVRSMRCWLLMMAAVLLLAPTAAVAVVEDAKLIASDGASVDDFGSWVSISGNIALVGALFDDDNGSDSGSAYVFRYNGSTWIEEAKLTASDGAADDWFGGAVYVSGDTLLVGARFDDNTNGLDAGSVYVFGHNGSTWVEEAKLIASDGAMEDLFGTSISAFGNTVLVGASGNDDSGSASGSAYVFRYNGSSWVEEQKLTASAGEASDLFGKSVLISGNTAMIGAIGDDDNGSFSGSVYVFRYNGSTWVEEQKLTASDGRADDRFGFGVAISGDVAVVGAPQRDGSCFCEGGWAYVFRYNGSSWIEEDRFTASDGNAGDKFGFAPVVSGDTIWVGAHNRVLAGGGGSSAGAVYVFGYNGSSWVEEATLVPSDTSGQQRFGRPLSISDGVLLVGAFGDSGFFGAAYVFGEPVQVPALGPLGIALLLAALGATAYWMIRKSASAA